MVWQKNILLTPTPASEPPLVVTEEVGVSCQVDSDCFLTDERLFTEDGTCWPGACGGLDYSQDIIIAVNRDSFQQFMQAYQKKCGSPPSCPQKDINSNSNYKAGCLNHICQKVTTSTFPAPPTATSSREVTVTTLKNIYTRGENIEILIKNTGRGAIAATTDHTACSIVTLERKTSEDWQFEGDCDSEIPTLLVIIEAGEEKQVSISTVGKGAPHRSLPSGIYRVKFGFVAGKNPYTSEESQMAFSPEFKLR